MDKFLIPEGGRDLLSDECEIKSKLVNKSSQVFESFGYKEVITPTIEYYKTFNSEDSGLSEEDIYKFFDNKGRILVLRPDMTVPIARVVSTKFKDTDIPIRIRYNSNVFRVNESLGGKRNEYTDCGVELIGCNREQGDLEILITALELLKSLVTSEFKIEIGNINLFKAATKSLKISKDEKKYLGNLIEQKSLKELEEFLVEKDISNYEKEFFLRLPLLFGDYSILSEGRKLAFNDDILNALNEIEEIYVILKELGYEELISFDLGMAPRLNYYTGVIFKGYVSGVGLPVLSGGRYDNLFKTFDEDLKAVGFSVNLDLLIGGTELQNKWKKVYNIYYNGMSKVDAFVKAKELRECGNIVKLLEVDYVKTLLIKEEGNK